MRQRIETLVAASTLVACLTLAGCSDLSGLNNAQLPAGVADPNTLNTTAGAVSLYNYALCSVMPCVSSSATNILVTNVGGYMYAAGLGGLMSDELQSSIVGGTSQQYANITTTNTPTLLLPVDARQVLEGAPAPLVDNTFAAAIVYRRLQSIRLTTGQALGALATYGTGTSPALRGHLFALQGYAEIFLADLFCSGVPLSTLDYKADYTYGPSLTTTQVYTHALTLFDSALALSGDSVRILNLARVGRARTLLALGRYAEAGATASDVPTAYGYQFSVAFNRNDTGTPGNMFVTAGLSVANSEGINGLPYVSAADPRTPTTTTGAGTNTLTATPLVFPTKLAATPAGTGVVTMSDGIEARLIQAEVALQSHDVATWLTTLNGLRTTCVTSVGCTTPAPAGTGGKAGLPPLTDPGTDTARVSLTFRERAFWLFLTAHRQGDLRRLIRQYGRDPEQVYPTGPYKASVFISTSQYGSYVTVPIPSTERLNPNFNGCFDRGA